MCVWISGCLKQRKGVCMLWCNWMLLCLTSLFLIKKILLYEQCSGQVESVETPWAQLAVFCRSLCWTCFDNLEREAVRSKSLTWLCVVHNVHAPVLVPEDIYQCRKESLCSSLIGSHHVKDIWMKIKRFWPSTAELTDSAHTLLCNLCFKNKTSLYYHLPMVCL